MASGQTCPLMFPNKPKQFVVLFNNVLPKFCIPTELLQKCSLKQQKSPGQKVAFSCSQKIVPKNPFSKVLYIFDDFFLVDGDERLRMQEEYYSFAFQKSLDSCQNLIEEFLNCEGEFQCLSSPQEDSLSQTQSLDSMDLLFLQQFRLFLHIEDSLLTLFLLYPQLSLTVNCLTKIPKFVSLPLSEKLVQQKETPAFGQVTYGFLTLDSAKRIYPLSLEEKSKLRAYPICGVWVYGLHFNTTELESSLSSQ